MKYYLEYLQEKEEDNKIGTIRKKYELIRRKLKRDKNDDIEKVKEKSIDFGKDVGSEYWDEVREEIKEIEKKYFAKLSSLAFKEKDEVVALEKGTKALKKGGYVLAGTTMASLIIAGSYQSYKAFKEKALMECLNLSGKKKRVCMKIQRNKALKRRLEILNRSTINCKKSSHAEKCEAEIYSFSLKIKEKISDNLKEIADSLANWNVYR